MNIGRYIGLLLKYTQSRILSILRGTIKGKGRMSWVYELNTMLHTG